MNTGMRREGRRKMREDGEMEWKGGGRRGRKNERRGRGEDGKRMRRGMGRKFGKG